MEAETAEKEEQIAENPYGLLPIVLTYCRITNETVTKAFQESVYQVLWIASYEADRINKENMRLQAQLARR